MSALDMDGLNAVQPACRKNISVEQKGYTLNDMEALRKKLKKSDLKPATAITDEAKNGSSINIDMKTSLFEYMKEMWIGDMKEHKSITNVTPLAKAQAETNENGKADVEYTFEVTYEAAGNEQTVKIKCYPTKCRMQIQHMGGPSKAKEYLGGLHSPRYFGSNFILPWARKVIDENPNLDNAVLPYLRAELRRLDEKAKSGAKKNKVKNTANGQAECSSRKCSFQNTVVLSNTSAYGTCRKCEKYEHFRCAKTKEDEKEEILAGKLAFNCSNCLFKYPTEIGFENSSETTINTVTVEAIVHEEPIAQKAGTQAKCANHDTQENEMIQVEEIEEIDENCPDKVASDVQETFQCEICNFITKNEEEIKNHMDNNLNVLLAPNPSGTRRI